MAAEFFEYLKKAFLLNNKRLQELISISEEFFVQNNEINRKAIELIITNLNITCFLPNLSKSSFKGSD